MGLRLIETNEQDKLKVFALMNNNNALGLKSVPDGTQFDVNTYVLFEITNEKTGEVFESICLKGDEGTIYATRSQSVIKYINDMIENFGEEVISNGVTLEKDTGTSNNGRDFVTVSLVL